MNAQETKAIVPAEKRPVGPPTKYRPEYCGRLIEHMAEGATMNEFAAELGVARTTLVNWANANPDFAEAVAIAKTKCIAWHEKRGRDIICGGGGPGAGAYLQFVLKNLDPEQWQDRQQHEHVGKLLHGALSPEEAIAEARRRGLPERILEE